MSLSYRVMRFGLLVGLLFGALRGLSAQVLCELSGPGGVAYCDRFALTNRLSNAGDTFAGLMITQQLPSTSYTYLPGQSSLLLNGAPILTGSAADPVETNGTQLVWNLTNLVGSVNINHLLITELFYNTGGVNPLASNQWIELFNPLTNSVSLAGWAIRDALPGQTDLLPAADIGPREFLVVAASSNAFRALYTNYTGQVLEVADHTLGSSLNFYADGIFLVNSNGTTVDGVSYGASTAAFSPAASTTSVFKSLARDPAYQDANTRSDWIEHTPDPGSGRLPVGIPNGDVVTLVFGLQARCGAVSGQFTAQAAYQQPVGTPATNVASTFVTMLPGALTIQKTPSLQSAGVDDLAAWTITVNNRGLGAAVNVRVSDTLGLSLIHI